MTVRWTPRLRTVLVSVNLLILVILVGGIVLLRLYESVLVRRTEAELIAQAAHVAAAYRVAVERELAAVGADPAAFGVPASPGYVAPIDAPFVPWTAGLDLARDLVLPSPEPARVSSAPADRIALAAGETIAPALLDAQWTTLAGIRVVDATGGVVANTRTELGESLAHREEVARALLGENVSLLRERVRDDPPPPMDSIQRGARVRVFAAMPVVAGDRVWGAVVLSRTPMSLKQSLYGIRAYLLLGALVLVALTTFLGLLTSRTISRPMAELIGQTERVARGERGAATPLANPGTYEVRLVSDAVARMARTLEQRADYIHTFASGVSHEFKTPLTAIRGAVELLRDHAEEMTAEERNRFLGNLEADAARLDRLVTRLTDLARADVVRPAGEAIEVAPLAAVVVARARDLHPGFQVELDGSGGRAAIDRELLDSILTNLLDNARQHGGEGVNVHVTLGPAEGREEGVEIRVVDDGPGISEANQERVFERFFTTARDRGGSGLGLSIVRTLVEIHGGEVWVASRPGETVFRLWLSAGIPGPGRPVDSCFRATSLE